jgi:hypothetical protein
VYIGLWSNTHQFFAPANCGALAARVAQIQPTLGQGADMYKDGGGVQVINLKSDPIGLTATCPMLCRIGPKSNRRGSVLRVIHSDGNGEKHRGVENGKGSMVITAEN